MKNLFTHIISDIRSWPKLKEKLSRYNTSNEKDGCKCTTAGILFEYFAKYYFQIEPTVKDDYKEVWLYDEIPLEVKRVLNIGDIEHGVDLLLMDVEGNYIPVQCKFKNDETQKLSWSKDKISNLFAFIPNAKRYIVFSNTSDIDDVSRSRYQGFNFFSIQNLLEISAQTFSNIHFSILSDQLKTENKRFSPKPFQQDAINAAKEHFKNYSRGQLILPCGAGKTLTALWIKESLNSTKVLVLVPSLALLRQIKNQWAVQRNHSFRYLCVCSEISIDNASDGIVTHTYDLDCSVTTESSTIRDFVTKLSPFVIYSTYQSLKTISDAISGLDFVFDLAICDEAHRTAGVDKSLFGLIHDNTLIPAAFRLYMTATPRVFSATIKCNLESENTFLFDMSDSNIFGTEFYRMSFKKAIEEGILVDYKIISIGVSSSDVKKYIDNRYFLETGHTADTIANIVALEKVIHKYNATHAISFHSRIKYAEAFSKIGAKLWANISTDFISGEMTTGTRSILLDNFKKKPVAVLSNARCLTEDVDLPAIDLVYFCDPKNSKIDIVQASGRALRTNREKPNKIGLIVVPIYHTDNDNLEEAVDKSCFKNLIQVIRSLSDQDERLQDEINCLAFSKGKRSSDSLHFEYIDTNIEEQSILVFNNFAEKLKNHIFTQVIEKTCSNWDLCLLELKEWIDKYGDYPNYDNNRFLYRWVSYQRNVKREGKLSIDRLNKLDEMGFPWAGGQEFNWVINLKQLEIWQKENQNHWPSFRKPKSAIEKKLAIWMFKIGSDYKSNKLDERRLQQLHDIGYLFEDRIWHKKYDKLREYLATGDLFPKNSQDPLYKFCMDQIEKFNNKSLSNIQIQLLEKICFFNNFGDIASDTFEEALNSLYRYKVEKGKMPPRQYVLGKNGTYKFGSLSQQIRSAYSDNLLSKQSIDDLNRIGFVFNSELKRNEEWNSIFNILCEFRIKYPDRRPNATIDDEKKLSAWCLHQRQWYNGKKKKYGPYPQERKDKLDSIGFMWELRNYLDHDDDSAFWEECFSKYLDFCRDNPNLVLPHQVNGVSDKVCMWYYYQRSLYRKNKLPIDKVQKFQEAGILDNLDKESGMSIWNVRLDEYVAFRQNNGTSKIPYKVNGKNNPLSAWFYRQRYLFQNNKLSDDKISKLREAGILENV